MRIFMVAFGRKKKSGEAHILYNRVDARDMVLARSTNARQELRN